MRLRRATPDDLPALKKLIKNSWHPLFVGASDVWLREETLRGKLKHFDERLYAPFKSYVVVDEGEIIAFATAQTHRGRFWIGDVFVDKRRQKHGVGSFMIKKLLRGKKEAYLEVNKKNNNAVKFWKELGFRPELEEFMMVKR